MTRRLSLLTILLVALASALALSANDKRPAEQFGQVTGQVTDSTTGDPVSGASVLVVGTDRGAMTDIDGRFTINRLSPGAYTLRFSSIGYNTVEVTDVISKEGLTTELTAMLTAVEGELEKTITVTAHRDVIDKFEVANQRPITGEPRKGAQINLNSAGNPRVDPYVQAPSALEYDAGGVDIVTSDGTAHGINRRPSRRVYPHPSPYNLPNGVQYDAMYFQHYGTNPFVDTDDDHLSTFAIDVDDASWTLTKSYLERGSKPPIDAVRVEEFINRFEYNYEAPRHETFTVYIDGGDAPFGPTGSQLVSIGIKGREIARHERKPVNLVFVIDVSGSMGREDRLGLVKRSLIMLVDQLRPNDQIGIVVFGSTAHVLLHPVPVQNGRLIKAKIAELRPGGSTNAAHGLQLGYEMMDEIFSYKRTNQVILCSDGVANTGTTDPDKLLRRIRDYADRGISLMTVGFGMGNYNDVLMEKLGDKGDGQYAYVNDFAQARRLFVDRLAGSLEVIAKDVKIQVDFNPNIVRSWRLLGYENRDVEDHKFRDDSEDGGEIYAGHSVTALYEIKLRDNRRTKSDIGTVHIRFVDPRVGEVQEVAAPINRAVASSRFADSGPALKMAAAAAEFAEILRDSYWARGSSFGEVRRLAMEAAHYFDSEETDELLQMIDMASRLTDYHVERW